MAARLVDHPRDLGLGQPLALGEPLVGPRLLDRIEILALEVLDQREGHDVAVVEIADQRRNFVQLRASAPRASAARRRPAGSAPRPAGGR